MYYISEVKAVCCPRPGLESSLFSALLSHFLPFMSCNLIRCQCDTNIATFSRRPY